MRMMRMWVWMWMLACRLGRWFQDAALGADPSTSHNLNHNHTYLVTMVEVTEPTWLSWTIRHLGGFFAGTSRRLPIDFQGTSRGLPGGNVGGDDYRGQGPEHERCDGPSCFSIDFITFIPDGPQLRSTGSHIIANYWFWLVGPLFVKWAAAIWCATPVRYHSHFQYLKFHTKYLHCASPKAELRPSPTSTRCYSSAISDRNLYILAYQQNTIFRPTTTNHA